MTAVAALLAEVREAFRPPPRLHLDEWADEHFMLPPGDANAGRWRTLPYQRGILRAISDPGIERISVMKSARVGWALDVDTWLPTPNGWVTMALVRVGDSVFDETGRPCSVTFKSPVYLNRECYRVRFCDGSEIVADADHLWAVESDVALEYLTGERGRGKIGRPKPGETVTMSGVVRTADMAHALTARRRRSLTVRNAQPLDAPITKVPIPPYTLGLWLGDGNLLTPRITQHRTDVETADYVGEEGISAVVRYIDPRLPNNATIFLDVPEAGRPISPWARVFRDLGLMKRKHIPPIYLRASVPQRLALLRGLMDSDGTIGKDGRAEFNNTNEELSRGVYELVVSLGMKASWRPRTSVRAGWQAQHRVNFKARPELNPFKLRRKAARVKDMERPSITLRRRVVSVEPVESVAVQCIAVDSPSSLYLAGHAMIPTHNTKSFCAAIGYYIEHDPSQILIVQPTIDDAQKHSKEDIAPMLREVVSLRGLVAEPKSRDSANTILEKAFRGGSLSLVGANSARGFRRTSRRIVIFDEVDAYPPTAGDEGDQIELAIRRSEYYWNRKILAGSTPTRAHKSRIERLFLQGNQQRYYVPCPSCGVFQVLRFEQMKWPSGDPERAYFICTANGCVMEHADKRRMVEGGEWRAEAPEHFTPTNRHASFHIWAAYSFSPNATWADIARQWAAAAHAGSVVLQTVKNTVLGEVWTEAGEAPDWEGLMRRRESYQIGTCPFGVLFCTCGVDVQKDRLVYEVVGWGRGKTSWSIDFGTLIGETGDMDRGPWPQLDALLARSFQHASGAQLPILRLAIDSGYSTQQVYTWARRYPMSRVIAIKGLARGSALLGAPSPVEVTDRGRKIKRGYRVWTVVGAIAKTELYGQLRLQMPVDGTPPPPGFVHFPEYGEDYFRQLTAEQEMTRKTPAGFMSLEWELIPGRENHALDARVYARAAAMAAGLDRFQETDWQALERSVGQEPAPQPAAALPPAPSIPPQPVRPTPWLARAPSSFWERRR